MSPGFQIWNLDLPTLEIRPSKFGDSPYGHFPNLEGRISKFGRSKFQIWKPGDIEAPSPNLPNLFSKVIEKSNSIHFFDKPKTSSATFSTTVHGNFSTFPKSSVHTVRKFSSNHRFLQSLRTVKGHVVAGMQSEKDEKMIPTQMSQARGATVAVDPRQRKKEEERVRQWIADVQQQAKTWNAGLSSEKKQALTTEIQTMLEQLQKTEDARQAGSESMLRLQRAAQLVLDIRDHREDIVLWEGGRIVHGQIPQDFDPPTTDLLHILLPLASLGVD
jgi:hypothetical protein